MGLVVSKRLQGSVVDANQLEQWMTQLRDDIKTNIPIIYLAIPGSHNSMTFGINRNSKLAPDADPTVRRIYRYLPWFVSRWAKTQNYSVTDQLNYGIRFFDLRISKLENVTQPAVTSRDADVDIYYFVHGLYSGPVETALIEINTFLEHHPGELVILDFQHFYDIGNTDHYLLYRYIKYAFGDKLYGPHDGKLAELTLTQAYKRGKQVVVIYRGGFLAPEYWSGSNWPTPWPQTADLKTLQSFLKNSLEHRSLDYGWVSQCILTPDAQYIAKRPLSNLKNTAKRVVKYLEDWIGEQIPGPWDENDSENNSRVNVIIADYVNLKNSLFTMTVINLNNKIPITNGICVQGKCEYAD